MQINNILNKIADGHDLSFDEATYAFSNMMEGKLDDVETAAILVALRTKGECADEVKALVSIMRDKVKKFNAPDGSVDIVGTGGDAKGSVNISTMASFVVAASGINVAKHGNRALSSRSGAADLFSALDINTNLAIADMEEMLRQHKLAFMFAPIYHPAMAYVQPIRQILKLRTLFNICGPLSSPAEVKHMLIGSYDKKWLEPMANTLKDLGAKSFWVVSSENGMDELVNCADNHVIAYKDNKLTKMVISAKDFAVAQCDESDLKGGSAEDNARIALEVFNGKKGAVRDVVLMNAAAAIYIAQKADSLQEAASIAADAIDSKKVIKLVQKVSETSKMLSDNR